MLSQSLLILLAVTSVLSSEEIKEISAEEQDEVILTLGKGGIRWERQVDATLNEHIIQCSPYDRRLRCRKFVPKDISELETRAHVLENGSLVIEKAKVTDSGIYFPVVKKGRNFVKAEKKDTESQYDAIKLTVKPSKPIKTIYY